MTEQRNGLVLKCIGGFYYVEAADAVYECRARGIFRKREMTPLAGDHVRFTPQEGGTGSLDAVESRRNFLVRPPVANVDCLLVVAAVTDPAPHLLVLDKMIAIAEYKGIEPVVVVNKCDLGSAQALEEIYRKAGLQVIALSAGKGQGIDELRTHIAGKVSVLTGNSGVGKSSLLNRIDPALQLETGEISRKLGRGRHTTRVACLIPWPEAAISWIRRDSPPWIWKRRSGSPRRSWRAASGNSARLPAAANTLPAPMSRRTAAPSWRRWSGALLPHPGRKAMRRCITKPRNGRNGSINEPLCDSFRRACGGQ